jgi:hypothetical protein
MSATSPALQWQDPAFVQQFLRNVRGSVPLAIEQIDTMLRLISACGERVRTFLILGTGDSMLAAAMLDEYPGARGWLVAESDTILDAARRHLRERSDRLSFIAADVTKRGWMGAVLAGTPFDAIVSAFGIELATDRRKRALYRELHGLLAHEGLFINLEHVASAVRWSDSEWDDRLIDAIFGPQLKEAPHEERVKAAREFYTRVHAEADALAPLEVQCDWLREVGFENVDCFLKVQELAMFGGQRAADKKP